MAVTPLDGAQRREIEALTKDRRIGKVPPDLERASHFMTQAEGAINELANLTFPPTAFTVAYDACHDAGEALLAAYGYRTMQRPGQHQALGLFLKAILNTPPGSKAAERFESLRRTRNQQRYDARPVGASQVELAKRTAQELQAAARNIGLETHD